MKNFFQQELHHKIAAAFDDHITVTFEFPLPLPHTHITLTQYQVVFLLFDCLRFYRDFAYTPYPLKEDFDNLQHVRNTLLSIYNYFEWPLTPTTHFMTNEAIFFAIIDGTAYNTVQEGVEHKNFDDKVESRTIYTSNLPQYQIKTPWMNILSKQECC
eukprot:TRINITY_DN1198_c0_g2_i13.p1 TRINITY_DN1198_c0_g2~~TRINITY_DN1198_c0_g2_i13.p1  ORF type:complete len:157 (-),score=32.88 TRINITY_DN1198_c0_g2_i13:260-730(-)